MNILQKFEAKHRDKISAGRTIPTFTPGDTLRVNLKIREKAGKEVRERIQAYEGVCIARSGRAGINASFTVRKLSYGEGVERVFPLHSPRIESIIVVRRGSVRRAKLYYLRDRRGKAARIAEQTTGYMGEAEAVDETASKTVKQPNKKRGSKAKKTDTKAKKADK